MSDSITHFFQDFVHVLENASVLLAESYHMLQSPFDPEVNPRVHPPVRLRCSCKIRENASVKGIFLYDYPSRNIVSVIVWSLVNEV